LCSVCEVYNDSNWFDKRIRWKHGNSDIIKFWEDCWVGVKPLKKSFPRLYSVSISKEKVVNEMSEWISNENREYFRWMLSLEKKTIYVGTRFETKNSE